MSKRRNKYNFEIGFALILGSDIYLWIISVALFRAFKQYNSIFDVFSYLIYCLGFLQYIYVFPLIVWQLNKQNKKLAYGMFIGSLPALLLNIAYIVWLIVSVQGYYQMF